MDRPKLSIPQQIQNMKDKGITFDIVSESEARRFLDENTYYFKLKAYAHNYARYTDPEKQGKYINLDFAYLKDLSTIDALLRKIIFELSIDLEHFLKVKMLSHFNTIDEDGYEIVSQLFKMKPDLKNEIEQKMNTSTCSIVVKKYQDSWAIWNIVEVLSFGDFIDLYALFYNRNQLKGFNPRLRLLYPVKMLRNAAAHNNCLINQLRPPYSRTIEPTYELKHFVKQISKSSDKTIEKKLTHPTIHDFIALLRLYCEMVPERTRSYGMKQAHDFFEGRILKHKDYYAKEQTITSAYKFVKSVIDGLYNLYNFDVDI